MTMKDLYASLFLLLFCLVWMTSAQTADVEVRINEEEPEGSFVVNIGEEKTEIRRVEEHCNLLASGLLFEARCHNKLPRNKMLLELNARSFVLQSDPTKKEVEIAI